MSARVELPNFNEKCNCGREGRYVCTRTGQTQCNKYMACPPYEELETVNADLRNDLLQLLNASGDLALFRESTNHYREAERIVSAITEKYKIEGKNS